MPYGVSDSTWRMLPADDQAAVKAGYDAATQSADGGDPGGGSGGSSAPSGPVAIDFGGASRTLAAFEQDNLHAPDSPDAQLPSKAWADTRDYMVYDQPFLATRIRAQGSGLRGVVGSDLWSAST